MTIDNDTTTPELEGVPTADDTDEAAADEDAGHDDFDKVIADLEADRDQWKDRAEKAESMVDELREKAQAAEEAAKAAQAAADVDAQTDQAASDAAGKGAQTTQDPPDDGPAVDDKGGGQTKSQANAEAAKWRKRLRDTEAERDALGEKLTAERDAVQRSLDQTRRGIVDGLLAQAGLDIRALDVTDHSVESLFDDDGTVNTERLAAAAGEARGLLSRPRRPQPNPLAGRGGGAVVEKSGEQIWREVFTG